MKNTLRSAVLAAAALILLAGRAPAQLIVGNDQSGTASIYHIDVGTGAATAIYTSTGTTPSPGAWPTTTAPTRFIGTTAAPFTTRRSA